MISRNTITPGTFCTALTTLRAASRILRESGCGSLPVYFEGLRAGTVGEREIRSLVAEKGPQAWELLVQDALERAARPAATRVAAAAA
jgi:CBS domain-containing protein